ncbi:alpha-ketoacid dehydrogenase subunit beta [Micropruina sp.]|uniref:alpha-ketoacid dehydrogenase subunit beta n=1 Tax=Micropruina sp. TaxID=2737536 RepID=UPI0039E36732
MATMTLAKALNAGLRRALEADPKVLLTGEDIGKLGGVFRITEHLQRDFGADRVVDTPLAESGILGTAIGLALRGYRPVVEIQFDGFVYPAFDQIISQLSRFHFRSHGRLTMPIVVRIPYGGGIGAIEHHSESPEAYFAHTPGLKVVTCSNPLDAYWMMQQSIASNDPIIFMEPKRRYHEKGEVDVADEPMPLFQARVVKPGDDLTLVTYGPMVRTCAEVAIAAAEEGHDIEVIDLRSLAPLDMATVIESVHKTGRAIVVHEAALTLGIGAEIAARVQQECFYALQAPVLRVTGYDIPYPPSRVEAAFLPDLDRVLDAVDRSMAY